MTKLAAIGRELDLIDARKQRAVVRAPEPDEIRSDEVEIKMFDRKFEIQAASPQLVAKESGEENQKEIVETASHCPVRRFVSPSNINARPARYKSNQAKKLKAVRPC